jgi:peptide/nickel transport system permease protein
MSTVTNQIAPVKVSAGSRTQMWLSLRWKKLREDWRIFSSNRLSMLGLILLFIFSLMAVIHPLLLKTVWPKVVYDPVVGYDIYTQPWPNGPSAGHLLGVDALGRDIFSMLLAATHTTFIVAASAALTAAFISTLIASTSAYFRGPIDTFFSNISNSVLILPVPVMMVLLASRYWEIIGPWQFGLIYGLLAGASSAAIVLRAHALKMMTKPFIDAARVAGGGSLHILVRHLIPHMLPLVTVQMMLTAAGAVVADGFIAFLGLRAIPELNWGTMVYNSLIMSRYTAVSWEQLLAPTICLSLFTASMYFVARGIDDLIDPRIRKSKQQS